MFIRVLAISTLLCLLPVAGLATEWQELDWTELMPPEDLALLENMPVADHEGDEPVTLPEEIMEGNIRPELDGTPLRIPGFIVPLQVNDDQKITEFFLVPYFGACIHVPAPPPNQITHVTYAPGYNPDALYHPFWIQGVLHTDKVSNDVADASYVMDAVLVEPYQEAY